MLEVIEKEGIQTVNARDLWEFMGIGKDFSTWIKDRIERFRFKQDRDYSPNLVSNTGKKGHPK